MPFSHSKSGYKRVQNALDDVASNECPALGGGGCSVCATDCHSGRGRKIIDNKHSTAVEHPPPHPRVCMIVHPEGKQAPISIFVLVSSDPHA